MKISKTKFDELLALVRSKKVTKVRKVIKEVNQMKLEDYVPKMLLVKELMLGMKKGEKKTFLKANPEIKEFIEDEVPEGDFSMKNLSTIVETVYSEDLEFFFEYLGEVLYNHLIDVGFVMLKRCKMKLTKR